MNSNIYRLRSEIEHILAEIDNEVDLGGEGELSPEQMHRILDLEKESDAKVDLVFKLIRHATINAMNCRAESARLSKRAAFWEGMKDRFRFALMMLLKAWKATHWQTSLCNPTICTGPPKVEVREGFDLNSLASTEYRDLIEQKTALSASKVRQLVRAGKPLPDGIKMVEGDPYLRL